MILYPAIDLKDGNCVRLKQGDMGQSTVFSNSPADQAASFAAQGASWIHIVDLNGAFAGKPVNSDAVKSIIKSVKVKLQLGGGIRDIATVESWLSTGITRVIIGTAALTNPELVVESCKKFPGKVAVGIDAKNEFVATDGWAKESNVKALDLAKMFEDAGVSAIIYTDVAKDGMMQGPNIESIRKMAETISIPVIASGGVSSYEDLRNLKTIKNLDGAICGRAIYDGAVEIKKALEIIG